MARVIISNHSRTPLIELGYASNILWRKALNSYGYCAFDLALTDPYATTTYLNPGNYVHVYSDVADTSQFKNANFGGVLSNDYEIKPKEGVVKISAAGLGQLLDVSIVTTTATYTNTDVGTIINSLLTNCDNWSALNLTKLTVDVSGAIVTQYVAGWGDPIFTSIQKLCRTYGGDFEVRPDWTYAYYIRQGFNRPDYVVRYGQQGNIQTDTQMHFVNTQMANQVYNLSATNNSVYASTVNTTSVQFYGPRTVVIQDQDTYSVADALTKAQFEAKKRAFPQTTMDNIVVVDTSLLPFYLLNLGDAVAFESPTLPFLSAFQGLQRILAIEYDDRKRIMNLTMGNALYIVLRGKLHEIRLYTS